MSVILDALKRVQDENRRRGASPVTPEPGPMHGSNALLRRLSAPASDAPRATARRQAGPAVWIGSLAAVGIAVVATVLWWMQPSFSGPRANDGRALLTDLTADPRDAVRFPPASPQAGAFAPEAGLESRRLSTGADPVSDADANGELSDLSGNLPAVPDTSSATAAGGRQPEPGFSLEVENTAAAPSGGSGIDLTSDRPSAPSARRPAPVRTVESDGGNVTADRARGVPAASGTLVDPGVRTAFEEGVRAQKEGQHSRAEEAYRRALRHDPHNAKVNANLGVLYERLGRLEDAERHLRQASSVEPNNASVHNNLGVVLYRMGNYDGAMIEFNRTLSLDAERLDAYTNKGLIFTRWGRYEDAQRAFMQVLAFSPNDPLANYNLGLVYEEVDNIDRAVDHYYRFLESGGNDHPQITKYLTQHLTWLEARLDGGASR